MAVPQLHDNCNELKCKSSSAGVPDGSVQTSWIRTARQRRSAGAPTIRGTLRQDGVQAPGSSTPNGDLLEWLHDEREEGGSTVEDD
ncbi:Os08g0123701 [Oryza sativa Japonica Group]|uniref:Os08g0123701 protein n=1 Tax=Oryza sativa subsp. japonica TaxID=39947 RepID=A0A0P0XC06_ORYSJ|nr:Os08g0123701 [Oryza sativa Japonica Group]